LVRFFPLPEIIIVLAIAAIIFGPRTLWRMRRRHRGSRMVD
jgi:Sec-independent protein translocase protein TatA